MLFWGQKAWRWRRKPRLLEGWGTMGLSASKLLLSPLPALSCFILSHPLPFSFPLLLFPPYSANAQRTNGQVLPGWRGSWTKILFMFQLLLILSSNPTILIPIVVLGPLSHSGLTPTFTCLEGTPVTGESQQLASGTQRGPFLRLSTCSELSEAASRLHSLLPGFRVGWPYGLTGRRASLRAT